jgi:GTP-binding protein Era
MLDAAWNALRQTHGAILFLDATRYLKKEELLERDLRPVLGRFDTLHTPPVVALNKVDAVRPKERLLGLLSILGNLLPKAELIPVSALTGDGIERLLAAVRAFLPEGPPLFPVDQLSTAPVRFLASEIIREKLFLALNQELPYNVAVEIESWEERVGVTIIAAAVYTSKNSHKGMIVGRQGQNLKQVGQAARQDLKELLGTKVHLELWVKVREGWTEDGRFMLSLGLGT